MQDLGTEVGKLGSLLEVELVDGLGVIYYARVVVVHTVDVGPNLYLVGGKHRADERSCVVRTSALQIVDLAIGVAADKALSDIDLMTLVFLHHLVELVFNISGIRLTVFVCAHEVKGIEQHGIDSLLLQVVDNHVG